MSLNEQQENHLKSQNQLLEFKCNFKKRKFCLKRICRMYCNADQHNTFEDFRGMHVNSSMFLHEFTLQYWNHPFYFTPPKHQGWWESSGYLPVHMHLPKKPKYCCHTAIFTFFFVDIRGVIQCHTISAENIELLSVFGFKPEVGKGYTVFYEPYHYVHGNTKK